jgi:serine O-acetyltransferase
VFDDGLSLAHIGTITINADARVGRNCRIHPGVTIGSVRGGAPVIGDDVFIAPNVVIVGKIRIGDRVHIGPGAVVTESIPDDTVVLSAAPVQKPRKRPTWQDGRLRSSS